MAKRTVFVGKEYEQAYRSICFLIKNGGLDGSGYRVENDTIASDSIEYVLSHSEGHTEEADSFGFGPQGATWFAALRGEVGEDDNAVWKDFMQAAQKHFHKNYSVVEYRQQKKSPMELAVAERDAAQIAKSFAALFYPGLESQTLHTKQIADGQSTEDVLGVAMRIELSAAVTRGAPLPILAKVYFNSMAGRVRPMSRAVAESIDRNIGNIVPDDAEAEDEALAKEGGDTIDKALVAMEELIKDKKASFADYICYSDPSDEEHLETLRRQMSHGHFELECNRVDLLYITHIKTECYVCDLFADGVPVLRVTLGINNRFSVQCLNCLDDQLLVNRNELTYKNKEGEECTVLLDPAKAGFGLDTETLAQIRADAHIGGHFQRISCGRNPRVPGGCRQLKCADQLVPGTLYCKDCPYPEVIYTDFDGHKHETARMVVTGDTLQVFDKDDKSGLPAYGTCRLCRRAVTHENLSGGLCRDLCAKANQPKDFRAAGKKLYRQYRGILPATVRLFSLAAPKLCFEDDELILFAVGGKRYAYNKFNAGERGCLKKARRLK